MGTGHMACRGEDAAFHSVDVQTRCERAGGMKKEVEIGVDLLGKEEAEEIHGVAEEKEEIEMVEGAEDGVDGLIKY